MQLLHQFESDGFAVVNDFYSASEVESIIHQIETAEPDKELVRKSEEIFAIRQFFKAVPSVFGSVFNDKLKNFILENFGKDYFIVKSIYFDKPALSNWYVAYHQDLTISVDKKIPGLEGFGPWTVKKNQYAVQPPLDILEKNFTIRIHLDNTNEDNGALNVLKGSHKKGVLRVENIDRDIETEIACNVNKGGLMLMKPLLMHSSKRSTNNQRRRVLHIEFSNLRLPDQILWSEKVNLIYN
ncbi:MAG: phytanoyl-CoA dioxygenase family protein [Ferruginibacter sp.]